MKHDHLDTEKVIGTTRQWVDKVVVGLNLCPFAKRELMTGSLFFEVSEAETEEDLLVDLQKALNLINEDADVETMLLIHPAVLQKFYDYNEFLNYADALLVQMGLEGIYQIASFHPDYQFADTEANDLCNYTNKSPYPMLHLIAEESVEKAIESHPDSDSIPLRNIELLESLGKSEMQRLLEQCADSSHKLK